MKTKLKLLSLLLISSLAACSNQDHAERYPNLYWPGNFEHTLYGGNFSKALNVQLCNTENASAGGSHSWYLPPETYQHLELLTEGSGSFRIKFNAKASGNLPLLIKVVYMDVYDSTRTKDIPIEIIGDGNWRAYTAAYTLERPYPGPRTGEFLISCYNPGVEAWIDDVEVRRTSPDPEQVFSTVDAKLRSKLVKNGDFNKGSKEWQTTSGKDVPPASIGQLQIAAFRNVFKLGHAANLVPSIVQPIDASTIAGKKIRLSADVGFLSISHDAYSWAGIIINLKTGKENDAFHIPSNPSPLWCPIGLSPMPGSMKKIHAVYEIPEDAGQLLLQIDLQERVNANIGIVDNITLEILRD